MSKPKEAGGKKYWFFITEYYCPICGSVDTYRERREGKRPTAWEDRHENKEKYDYCNSF